MLKITTQQDIYIRDEFVPLLGFLVNEKGGLVTSPILDEEGNDTGETRSETIHDAIKRILNKSTRSATEFEIIPNLEAYFGKNPQGQQQFEYLKNLLENSAIVVDTTITEVGN